MSYDTKCYELAEIFLADDPDSNEILRCELARRIQEAIEDWLKEHVK